MSAPRLPRRALPALRSRVGDFLRDCRHLDSPSALDSNLAGFLLAALCSTLDEYPWLDRKGAVIDPPPDDALDVYALDSALDDGLDSLAPDAEHSVDSCLQALQRAISLEVADEPCGHRRASPRSYEWYRGGDPLFGRDNVASVVGVVAEPGWVHRGTTRDEVFNSIHASGKRLDSFVLLKPGVASTLAQALLAGRGRQDHSSVAPATPYTRDDAERFLRLLGDASGAFAPEGLNPFKPFAPGAPWCEHHESGDETQGRWASLFVSDGWRVATLMYVWDRTSLYT